MLLANDLLMGITKVWNHEMRTTGRKLRRTGQRRAFTFGVSVATLTLAKYYLRATHGGELWWPDDIDLLETYDAASHVIAEKSIAASNALNAIDPDLTRVVVRHYPPRRNFRWAKLDGVDDDEPVPLHPSHAAKASAIAHRVELRLYDCLSATFDDENREAPTLRLVNLMAAGKIALGVFSDEPLVAALAENIAEHESAAVYTRRGMQKDDLEYAVAQYSEGVERTLASLHAKR